VSSVIQTHNLSRHGLHNTCDLTTKPWWQVLLYPLYYRQGQFMLSQNLNQKMQNHKSFLHPQSAPPSHRAPHPLTFSTWLQHQYQHKQNCQLASRLPAYISRFDYNGMLSLCYYLGPSSNKLVCSTLCSHPACVCYYEAFAACLCTNLMPDYHS
jgi:hypothetical protein